MQTLFAHDPTSCGPGSLNVADPTICPVPPTPPSPTPTGTITPFGGVPDDWYEVEYIYATVQTATIYAAIATAPMFASTSTAPVDAVVSTAVVSVEVESDDE